MTKEEISDLKSLQSRVRQYDLLAQEAMQTLREAENKLESWLWEHTDQESR